MSGTSTATQTIWPQLHTITDMKHHLDDAYGVAGLHRKGFPSHCWGQTEEKSFSHQIVPSWGLSQIEKKKEATACKFTASSELNTGAVSCITFLSNLHQAAKLITRTIKKFHNGSTVLSHLLRSLLRWDLAHDGRFPELLRSYPLSSSGGVVWRRWWWLRWRCGWWWASPPPGAPCAPAAHLGRCLAASSSWRCPAGVDT